MLKISSISVESLREKIRNTHPRTRKAQINTLFGLVIKGGGILISLILVPMTIDYLSKDTYGTWLTISSIVTMITFFDIGIGNGLRNKLSEAVSMQDMRLARVYVSTAYIVFGALQSIFIVLFLFFFRYIPWQKILNTSIDKGQLQLLVLIMSISVAIKMVLDILCYVLFALQKSGQVSLINLINNMLVLISTYILMHFTSFTDNKLIYIGLIIALSPILVLLIAGFLLYRKRLKAYKPTWQFADLKYAKHILSLGYKFFVIQMAVIVVFYTDNLIITQLFGPSEVTTYNIAFRYFNSINTVFAIIVTPYWSAFTEAFAKDDKEWMKNTYRYLQKLWLLLIPIVVIMVGLSKQVYIMWVGERVFVPTQLSICMGVFVIVSCWNSITVTVANGLGKIRLQLIYALAAAVVNVPLAILFSKGMNLESAGVALATSTSLLIGSVFGGIQAQRLLTNTARGIWNE